MGQSGVGEGASLRLPKSPPPSPSCGSRRSALPSPAGLPFLEGLPGPLAGQRPSPKSHGQRAPEAPLRRQSRPPLLHRAPDAAEPDEMSEPDSFVKRERAGERAIIPSQSHEAAGDLRTRRGLRDPTEPCFLGGGVPPVGVGRRSSASSRDPSLRTPLGQPMTRPPKWTLRAHL